MFKMLENTLAAPPDHLAGGGCPFAENSTSTLGLPFGLPTLALRASLLASPNPFTKIRLCCVQNTYVASDYDRRLTLEESNDGC